jgi:hypothetical protein
MSGNLRHQGIQIPERDRASRRGQFVAKRLNVDTAGWARLDRVEEYYNGGGFVNDYGNKSRAAECAGYTYNGDLPPKTSRAWCIDQNDMVRVVVKSNNDANAWSRRTPTPA